MEKGDRIIGTKNWSASEDLKSYIFFIEVDHEKYDLEFWARTGNVEIKVNVPFEPCDKGVALKVKHRPGQLIVKYKRRENVKN